MKIYDCFSYWDEDLLLEVRLNILNNHVDYFVIVEGNKTWQNNHKDLRFDINNFSKFKKKIIYVPVEDMPDGDNPYKRENFQRNCISRGISSADDKDLILISDLDEIPNPETIYNFNIKDKFAAFKQNHYYYKINLQSQKNPFWYGSRICVKKYLKSPQWLREIKAKKYSKYRIDLMFSKKKYSDIFFVDKGGWHFTYLKNYVDLEKKLLNFAHHHEFEISGINQEDIKKMIEDRKAIYNHQVDQKSYKIKWGGDIKLEKVSNSILPNYVVKNLINYKEWLD